MTWNYRIIRHDNPRYQSYKLHEVDYDELTDNIPSYWSKYAIGFLCDVSEGVEGIIKDLEAALRDARIYPVLVLGDDGKLREEE